MENFNSKNKHYMENFNSKNKHYMENGIGVSHLDPSLQRDFRTRYWEPPVDYAARNARKQHDTKDVLDSASVDSAGQKKSFSRIFVRFADKTSMTGVPYIKTAKLKVAKLVWVFLLLVFIVIMALHLWYLCDQFFSYPKQTKISLGFDNLKYPAITICNVNAVRKSRLSMMSQELQELTEAVSPTQLRNPPPPPPPEKGGSSGGSPGGSQGGSLPGTGGSSGGSPGGSLGGSLGGSSGGVPKGPGNNQGPLGRRKRFVQNLKDLDFDRFSKRPRFRFPNDRGGKKSAKFQLQETFEDLYMQENRTTRIKAGYMIEEMLLSCSFSGVECYAENFTMINHPVFGNCFTLYSDEYRARLSGPKSGFSIELYTETDDYLDGIAQGYGARVIIHPGGTFPFPDDEGKFVPSGWETDIGLKLVEISRLDGNFGHCDHGVEFKEKYKLPYTRRTCQLVCEQEDLLKECGCVDKTHYELFYSMELDYKFCVNDSELTCMGDLLKLYAAKEKICSCHNPCRESQYQTYTSLRQWPTDEYAGVLQLGVCENLPSKCNKIEALSSTSLSRNFMKLTVYYDDLNYEFIEETPEIREQQFASDIGGAIGLWIGLSLLSIFEVIQLFFEICQYGCHKCSIKRDGSETSSRRYIDPKHIEKTLAIIRNDSRGRFDTKSFDTYPHRPHNRRNT